MSSGGDWGGAGPSRSHRLEQRRHRLVRAVAVVGVAGLLAAGVVAFFSGRDAPAPAPTPSEPGVEGPSALLALSVTGSPNALVAVIGSGGRPDPAAIVLPSGLTVIAPGQGETTLQDVKELSGESMRIAVSNAVGAWAARYAVTDLDGFGDLVDAMEGLTVNLPDVVTVGERVLGPGETKMRGAQVATYLSGPPDDTTLRWALVLESFLAAAPALEPGDLTETDDAAGAAAILQAAEGAFVEVAPSQIVGGTVLVPMQPEFDDLVAETFGTPAPVPALVQNGNGIPGIGEVVAALIIPERFRIVLAQNADSFDKKRTEIFADGEEHLEDAQRVRDALGVGVVKVSQVPSGLADVLIVVGRDFEG